MSTRWNSAERNSHTSSLPTSRVPWRFGHRGPHIRRCGCKRRRFIRILFPGAPPIGPRERTMRSFPHSSRVVRTRFPVQHSCPNAPQRCTTENRPTFDNWERVSRSPKDEPGWQTDAKSEALMNDGPLLFIQRSPTDSTIDVGQTPHTFGSVSLQGAENETFCTSMWRANRKLALCC